MFYSCLFLLFLFLTADAFTSMYGRSESGSDLFVSDKSVDISSCDEYYCYGALRVDNSPAILPYRTHDGWSSYPSLSKNAVVSRSYFGQPLYYVVSNNLGSFKDSSRKWIELYTHPDGDIDKCSPIVLSGYIFLCASHSIISYSLVSRKIEWTKQFNSRIYSLSTDGSMIYVYAGDILYCLSFDMSLIFAKFIPGQTNLRILKRDLTYMVSDQSISSIFPNGDIAWTQYFQGGFQINSSFIEVENSIIFSSTTSVFNLSRTTGEIHWSAYVGPLSGNPLYSETDGLVVGTSSGFISQISPNGSISSSCQVTNEPLQLHSTHNGIVASMKSVLLRLRSLSYLHRIQRRDYINTFRYHFFPFTTERYVAVGDSEVFLVTHSSSGQDVFHSLGYETSTFQFAVLPDSRVLISTTSSSAGIMHPRFTASSSANMEMENRELFRAGENPTTLWMFSPFGQLLSSQHFPSHCEVFFHPMPSILARIRPYSPLQHFLRPETVILRFCEIYGNLFPIIEISRLVLRTSESFSTFSRLADSINASRNSIDANYDPVNNNNSNFYTDDGIEKISSIGAANSESNLDSDILEDTRLGKSIPHHDFQPIWTTYLSDFSTVTSQANGSLAVHLLTSYNVTVISLDTGATQWSGEIIDHSLKYFPDGSHVVRVGNNWLLHPPVPDEPIMTIPIAAGGFLECKNDRFVVFGRDFAGQVVSSVFDLWTRKFVASVIMHSPVDEVYPLGPLLTHLLREEYFHIVQSEPLTSVNSTPETSDLKGLPIRLVDNAPKGRAPFSYKGRYAALSQLDFNSVYLLKSKSHVKLMVSGISIWHMFLNRRAVSVDMVTGRLLVTTFDSTLTLDLRELLLTSLENEWRKRLHVSSFSLLSSFLPTLRAIPLVGSLFPLPAADYQPTHAMLRGFVPHDFHDDLCSFGEGLYGRDYCFHFSEAFPEFPTSLLFRPGGPLSDFQPSFEAGFKLHSRGDSESLYEACMRWISRFLSSSGPKYTQRSNSTKIPKDGGVNEKVPQVGIFQNNDGDGISTQSYTNLNINDISKLYPLSFSLELQSLDSTSVSSGRTVNFWGFVPLFAFLVLIIVSIMSSKLVISSILKKYTQLVDDSGMLIETIPRKKKIKSKVHSNLSRQESASKITSSIMNPNYIRTDSPPNSLAILVSPNPDNIVSSESIESKDQLNVCLCPSESKSLAMCNHFPRGTYPELEHPLQYPPHFCTMRCKEGLQRGYSHKNRDQMEKYVERSNISHIQVNPRYYCTDTDGISLCNGRDVSVVCGSSGFSRRMRKYPRQILSKKTPSSSSDEDESSERQCTQLEKTGTPLFLYLLRRTVVFKTVERFTKNGFAGISYKPKYSLVQRFFGDSNVINGFTPLSKRRKLTDKRRFGLNSKSKRKSKLEKRLLKSNANKATNLRGQRGRVGVSPGALPPMAPLGSIGGVDLRNTFHRSEEQGNHGIALDRGGAGGFMDCMIDENDQLSLAGNRRKPDKGSRDILFRNQSDLSPTISPDSDLDAVSDTTFESDSTDSVSSYSCSSTSSVTDRSEELRDISLDGFECQMASARARALLESHQRRKTGSLSATLPPSVDPFVDFVDNNGFSRMFASQLTSHNNIRLSSPNNGRMDVRCTCNTQYEECRCWNRTHRLSQFSLPISNSTVNNNFGNLRGFTHYRHPLINTNYTPPAHSEAAYLYSPHEPFRNNDSLYHPHPHPQMFHSFSLPPLFPSSVTAAPGVCENDLRNGAGMPSSEISFQNRMSDFLGENGSSRSFQSNIHSSISLRPLHAGEIPIINNGSSPSFRNRHFRSEAAIMLEEGDNDHSLIGSAPFSVSQGYYGYFGVNTAFHNENLPLSDISEAEDSVRSSKNESELSQSEFIQSFNQPGYFPTTASSPILEMGDQVRGNPSELDRFESHNAIILASENALRQPSSAAENVTNPPRPWLSSDIPYFSPLSQSTQTNNNNNLSSRPPRHPLSPVSPPLSVSQQQRQASFCRLDSNASRISPNSNVSEGRISRPLRHTSRSMSFESDITIFEDYHAQSMPMFFPISLLSVFNDERTAVQHSPPHERTPASRIPANDRNLSRQPPHLMSGNNSLPGSMGGEDCMLRTARHFQRNLRRSWYNNSDIFNQSNRRNVHANESANHTTGPNRNFSTNNAVQQLVNSIGDSVDEDTEDPCILSVVSSHTPTSTRTSYSYSHQHDPRFYQYANHLISSDFDRNLSDSMDYSNTPFSRQGFAGSFQQSRYYIDFADESLVSGSEYTDCVTATSIVTEDPHDI